MNAPFHSSGFRDPVHEAQAAYRTILRALSRPGVPLALPQTCTPPQPLEGTMAALALTLLDGSTSLWLAPRFDRESVRGYLALRTGVRIVAEREGADFALLDATEGISLAAFRAGDAFEPHLAATLVVAVPSLFSGAPVRLAGPGIEDSATLCAAGLDEQFWPQWDVNAGLFPRGIDILLVDRTAVCGLPRTTRRI